MVPEGPGDGSQKHGGESRESGLSDQKSPGASGHFAGNKLPERAMGIMRPMGIRRIAFEFLKRFQYGAQLSVSFSLNRLSYSSRGMSDGAISL